MTLPTLVPGLPGPARRDPSDRGRVRGRRVLLRSGAACVAALTMTALVAPAAEAHHYRKPVSVRIIGFNDLHGNLQPPTGSSGRVFLADGTTVNAGGAAYLATHVKQLEKKNTVVVSGGDSIGASPLISALFHDEPTIDALNAIGVEASAVGNHEFDEGLDELERIQDGGCSADDCVYEPTYEGADFPILGANVRYTDTGRRALPAITVVKRGGVKIGIIGVTLRDLPSVVIPTAVSGLTFTDEVDEINQASRALQRRGVKAQIVLMHQGDETTGTGGPDACDTVAGGPASLIARQVSPRVDAIFNAHTHQDYVCWIKDPNGSKRPVIQGLSFGRLLSVVDLKISPRTHDVIRWRTKADNVVVTNDASVTPDPTVQAIIDRADAESAPLRNRPVGSITDDLTRPTDTSVETTLGDVIADAQLAATLDNGAQIAITNPGGIRADLTFDGSTAGEGNGVVTYGEAFSVQPFGNIMQTITLTGAQLQAVLEQQFQDGGNRYLQVSASLHYTLDLGAAAGSRVSDLELNGAPIDPAASYRVSVNNFLAAGGDGFTVFADGTDLTGGPIDLDALVDYLGANPDLAPPALDRVTVIGG